MECSAVYPRTRKAIAAKLLDAGALKPDGSPWQTIDIAWTTENGVRYFHPDLCMCMETAFAPRERPPASTDSLPERVDALAAMVDKLMKEAALPPVLEGGAPPSEKALKVPEEEPPPEKEPTTLEDPSDDLVQDGPKPDGGEEKPPAPVRPTALTVGTYTSARRNRGRPMRCWNELNTDPGAVC